MGISTSIGFYDFLNYLTIGAILSFIFVPWVPKSAEALALWAIPCFVAGLIFHKIVENTIGKCTRNNKELIEDAYNDKIPYCDFNIDKPCDMTKEYYRAYYCLLSNKDLGNIPRLEAISSFFQDLFCVIILYVSTTLVYWLYKCICTNVKSFIKADWSIFGNLKNNLVMLPLEYALPILILSVVLLLLLPILRYFTEKKIYGLVWEGYIFMHLNQKDIIT